ncbi:MAG: rhodanese-like domain-containing protein [Bacteroidia bacterium]|nr:rhodanese-like domain-containing protein [Bacteroidia bacterium]
MSVARVLSYCLTVMIASVLLSSCGSKSGDQNQTQDETAILLSWLNENGNWINSQQVPAIITATDAYESMNGNTLFIDLRDPSQFAAGHIPRAINIVPAELIDYLDNRLDINAFDKVIFVCSRGQLSAWVNGIVRLLGYNNTFSIRYGLNAWDTSFAASGWDKVVSDKYSDRLAYGAGEKPVEKFDLPKLKTGKKTGYEIAHERASALLAETTDQHFIEFDTLMAHPERYFVANYWSPTDYEEAGHLPGAFQFSPRKSLAADAMLHNIPPDRKVVLYCYTGHHSGHAVAFLRMLGYDAYSLLYGSNAFMHSKMTREGWPPSHAWSDVQKNTFPLTRAAAGPVSAGGQIKKAAQGGC